MRLIACALIETQRDSYARPLAATLNCLAGDRIDRAALAALVDTATAKTSLPARLGQLSNVSQTSSLWSFARILSADCSKMLRIRPLTTSFPGLKIKNQVPFSGTPRKAPFKTMSALDNAIEILRCFAPHQPEISNADVIRLTGKPKSSTSRLLRQLRECGLLEQDALTRRYRPGLLVFELGRLHRTQNDFVALAEQRLRAVCAKTGHTGYISVLDGAEQVVLRVVPGSNPLQVVTPPGVRAPAFATSNGRAMLARLNDADIRARMPKPLPAISPSAPRNLTALMARIAEIRRTGYSEASNESLPGVGSLGFALTRRDTNETIGVAVSYPSQLTSAEERAKLWQALRTMAVDLGRLFDDPIWLALGSATPIRKAAAR
ncbi:IclR family transcriptional regulator [Bradyrhizobium sp. AZCC 1693]|uniref:IclR family transcriptional regulator n=1 Tax=Bradyrhizobium sp. AZCC 1693 TaxID=3117029 RepID=UPI002FF094AF